MNFHWLYEQKTGKLYKLFDDGTRVWAGAGWAGQNNEHGKGYNNPALQNVHNTGPLPAGWYTIGDPYDSPHTGPFTLPLTPDATNEMYGRGDFKVHGPAKINPELSSEGCVIQVRSTRETVHNSGVKRLQVVSEIGLEQKAEPTGADKAA